MKARPCFDPVGHHLRLEYGKALPEADRTDKGGYPAYGANGSKIRSKKYLRDEPTVIVGRKGSAGEITLSEPRFWPLDVTYFLEFDRSRHDVRYLFHLFQWLDIPSLSKGVKPGINRDDVYRLAAPFPAFAQQQRTAAILDEAFEWIVGVAAKAEKNAANARSLFQEALSLLMTKDEWPKKPLEECLDKVRYTNKIQRKDFKQCGAYPIVSQEADFINGFWDDTDDVFRVSRPVVIFGDHTRVLKFVDFDFVLGADGVKILQPTAKFDSKFFYYAVRAIDLRAVGYARHYRLLKAASVPCPALDAQSQAVELLDELEANVSELEASYRRKLALLDELRRSLLSRAFSGDLTREPLDA